MIYSLKRHDCVSSPTSPSLLQVNILGAAVAVLCTAVTAQYQLYVGSMQTKLQVSSTQLLACVMPVASLVLLLLIPFVDDLGFFLYSKHENLNGDPKSAQSKLQRVDGSESMQSTHQLSEVGLH
jgi:hypothetical protein